MRVHFIGIGGIGVSALAQFFLSIGHDVSGSDLVSSEITENLKKKGIKIFIGKKKKENLKKDLSLVVYSPAIKKDNPEFREAKKRKILIQSYPEALGELTKKYFTIAVSGSHGKSTTTAMLSLILIKAGLDPTVILGTKLKEFGDSNFRVGDFPKSEICNLKSKILVIEADEHFASFLNYWPKIIVLTNIEREHLDYYKNLKNILKTYKEYLSHLKKDGILVLNKDCGNVCQVSQKIKNKKFYSIKQKEAKKIKKILKIPGDHNISDALAALTVARVLKIPDKVSFKALSEYKGAWRRFEIIKIKLTDNLEPRTCTLISDYGHHPTKVRVTLKAAREKYPKKKIWLVYQPHQYQRTYYLFNDFVQVFKNALRPVQQTHRRQVQGKPSVDNLIITDIFDVAGREEKIIKNKVSSEKLVRAINDKKTVYVPTIEKTFTYLKKNLKGGEVVIIMGAGDIYKLVDYFIK
jgi:UDP-N-acetylmuramate--alanine ligase